MVILGFIWDYLGLNPLSAQWGFFPFSVTTTYIRACPGNTRRQLWSVNLALKNKPDIIAGLQGLGSLEVFHFPLLEWYLRVVGKKKTFWTLLHKLQYRMWTPVFAYNSTPILSFVRWKWHFVHATDLNESPISTPQSLVPFTAYDYWYHPHLQYTGSLKAPPRPNFHWALLLWQFWSDIYKAPFYTTKSVCLANFKVQPSSTAMEKWNSHL